jgi:hypothetical protein
MNNLTDAQWNDLLNAWRKQNDSGNGEPFEFDENTDETIANLIDHPEVVLLAERGNQAIIQIATAHNPDKVWMACMANGPWLCEVTPTWSALMGN